MLRRCLIFILVTAFALSARAQPAKYEPTWESLRSRPYPRWFDDAKLGIFIHWGVYSVPAWSGKEQYGEWFLRGLQSGDSARIAFQQRVYGEDFTYRDYAPLFKAELFEADAWARLFARSGARYVILVSKHHDGYCLWPSQYAPDWNSMDVGPGRDLVGELTAAVRQAGLRMGLYYSLPEWNNELFRWYTDPNDRIGPYIEQHMIPQFKELIAAYRPDLVFADGEWFHSAETWHAAELIAWYYNLVGDDAIVNNRWGHGSDIGFLTPEDSAGLEIKDRPWAECRGLGRSFGLNRNESLDAYLSPRELIHFFVKAVSNGGGVTLNVGPKADGQIPLLQQERLLQLGEWLQVNGEAIYGTGAWEKTGEEKQVTLERVDSEIDFDWVRNTPGRPIAEDDFSAEWTGFIEPRFSERYRFYAEVDDSMQLWIGDEHVLTAVNGVDAASEEAGRIDLQAGKKYPIRIAFHEKKHQATMRLYWSSQSQAAEIVPRARLYTTRDKTAGEGLQATYRSMDRTVCYTVKDDALYAIALAWPDRELVLNLPRPPARAKVSLLGRQGDLDWRYEGGRMFIDVSQITYNEMPSQYAWAFRISGLSL